MVSNYCNLIVEMFINTYDCKITGILFYFSKIKSIVIFNKETNYSVIYINHIILPINLMAPRVIILHAG